MRFDRIKGAFPKAGAPGRNSRSTTTSGRRSKRPSVVVKAFPLGGLRNRLYRYRRYGPSEAANLLEAGRRNIPVPRVYAYGQIASRRFVDCTMIMMEDLGGHRSVGEMLSFASTNEARQITLLRRTGALLLRLYQGRCNHIDVNPQSVQVGETEADDRLIDFHYVKFLEKPSLRVLMFNLAYFANTVSDIVSEDLLHRWARWVLRELGIRDQAQNQWVSDYKVFRRRRLSRRRRLAIR